MNESTPVHKENGDNVPLKLYIERILDEREKAVALAYRNMEARLDRLNELRAEVQQDRGQFLRLDVFEEKHDALQKTVYDLEKTLTKTFEERTEANTNRIDGLESWRLKAVGAFLIVVPLSGIIGAAIMKAFS